MSETTVTTGTPEVGEEPRVDVRGIPLEHRVGYTDGDPFIGACPIWCDGDHRHWEGAEDRSHYSEPSDIALELEDGDYDSISTTFYVATIRTYLQQPYREAEPHVHLGQGDHAGLSLTLAEATLLRDRLSALLEAAQAGVEGAAEGLAIRGRLAALMGAEQGGVTS